MINSTENQVFSIPSWNVEILRAKIAKLNKRAVKLDCPALELVEHGTEERVHPDHTRKASINPNIPVPMYTVHNISIAGEGPKLAGWKFIGTLDHYTLPGSVIVKSVPGETIPPNFFHSTATCGHCNKIRRRIETFVVESEDGGYLQVGRQCIKDFMGHDPKGILSFLTSIRKLIEELEDETSEYYGSNGRQELMYDGFKVLEITSAIIRTHGWVSRAQARDTDKFATADDVINYFNPPQQNAKEYDNWKEWKDNIKIDAEADTADAEGAIDWLKEQDASSDYIHNLQAIARAEFVPMSMFGYWCSLIASYQRAMDRLRLQEREKENKLNEWIGDIKERCDFTVDVVSIKAVDGYYNVVYIHKMLDNEGRTLIWFANCQSKMIAGHKYNIVGTVKKHDEYNNWKQTSLSRVKVKEEIE